MPSWSTNDVPTHEQFGFWREVLCEAFITLNPKRTTSAGQSGFMGSVTANLVSQVNVTSLSHEAHRVVRGPAEISKMPLEYYFVNMQIDGEVLAEQRGRSVLIRPDEFYIVNSTEPYDLDYHGAPKTYSFRIPKPILDPLLSEPAELTTKRVSRETAMGALAVDFLQSVLRQADAIPSGASCSVANMIAEMVALSLDGGKRAGDAAVARGTARIALLASILKFIDRNLHNPALSVDLVCRRFGLSSRYLHRVFETADLTFGEVLRKKKLEACASELQRAPGRPISAIALSSGFSDISHFNHCFRKQFGVSPREYRREASGGGVAPVRGRAAGRGRSGPSPLYRSIDPTLPPTLTPLPPPRPRAARSPSAARRGCGRCRARSPRRSSFHAARRAREARATGGRPCRSG